MLFMGPTMLGRGVGRFVWVEMCDFSCFSGFWVKWAVVGRVLGAVMAVEGTDEFEMVQNDVGEEKIVIFDEFSQ